MGFTPVFHTRILPLSFFDGGGFSDEVDTRGCELFVFVISANQLSGPIASDNQGNHYFHDLNPAAGSGIKNVQAYSVGTTDTPGATPLATSANHVFQIGGGTYGQSCHIFGFSGVNASDPVDISGEGKVGASVGFIEADEVEASLNGNLIITGCTFANEDQQAFADAPFDDNQYTYGPLGDPGLGVAIRWGNSAAFYIQNPAAPITPTWNNAGVNGPMAASVTVFNVGEPPAPGPGGGGEDDEWFDTPKWVRGPST